MQTNLIRLQTALDALDQPSIIGSTGNRELHKTTPKAPAHGLITELEQHLIDQEVRKMSARQELSLDMLARLTAG